MAQFECLLHWLGEKEKEILESEYTVYKEGYLDAIMDVRNKVKRMEWFNKE